MQNIFERQRFSKLFETYVPLHLNKNDPSTVDGVVELYQDYAGIQRQTLARGPMVLNILRRPEILARLERTALKCYIPGQ